MFLNFVVSRSNYFNFVVHSITKGCMCMYFGIKETTLMKATCKHYICSQSYSYIFPNKIFYTQVNPCENYRMHPWSIDHPMCWKVYYNRNFQSKPIRLLNCIPKSHCTTFDQSKWTIHTLQPRDIRGIHLVYLDRRL